VYIEEVPSGVHPITGVATSIAAFLDFFPRGPLNTASQILSFADFEREFAGLDTRSEASYAIQQFFLNGGSECWVVRVGTIPPALVAADLATASTLIRKTPAGGSAQVLNVRAGRRIRGTSVPDPGAWANFVRVEVDYDVVAPSDPVQTFGELFNLTISEISSAPGRLRSLRSETYRNMTMRPGAANNALEVVNEQSKMVQLDRDGLPAMASPFDTTFRPCATGSPGASIPATTVVPGSGKKLRVNSGSSDHTATIPAAAPDLHSFVAVLEQAIRGAAPDDPLIAGASVRLINDDPTGANVRFHVIAGRDGATFDAAVKLTFSDDGGDTTATNLGLTAAPQVQQYALTGGQDGPAASSATLRGSRAAKTGLYALEDVDLFNILCVPASASLGDSDFGAVASECEAYCVERRAFLILDIPATVDEPADMQAWLAQNDTLRNPNAAVYFPRPLIADPLNGNRRRSVGASGTLAGLYARMDATRGVWKAPAGTETQLRGVQELDYVLTDAQNGTLNPLGVNCLRNFPVYGNVSWGGRTLFGADQQTSEWKYVPVRRIALFLEESLYRGTKWVVFEPNDEPLWAQIRLNVGAFMHNLFRQGAFQGITPREAYLVKCDKETTTQTDINNGVVNILVGFAPLKPAEFVIIRIQQLAGQIET
jgi:phage tail sheath protein FI